MEIEMTILEDNIYKDSKNNKPYELVDLQVFEVDYSIADGYGTWKAKIATNSVEEAIQMVFDDARQKGQTIRINTIGKVSDLHVLAWDIIKHLCLKYNDRVMDEIEAESLEKAEAVKKSGLYKQNRGKVEKQDYIRFM